MASGELPGILEQMRREEAVGKKEKPAFSVPKEKRLQYYSGWDKKEPKVNAMDEEAGRIKKREVRLILHSLKLPQEPDEVPG